MAEFFNEMTDASQLKATIVEKYFKAWAAVVAPRARSGKIGYIDLYSGPGRYEDGSESTPLKILRYCIDNSDLSKKIVTIFNDGNNKFATQLKNEIHSLAGIQTLKFQPVVNNFEVGDEIAADLRKMTMIPSMSFVDPWGYKGLTQNLIDALIKDWGSDTIFFFNYNRINMGIRNSIVTEHINAIFGEEKANELRQRVGQLSPVARESEIMKALAESLSNGGRYFILPFRFVAEGRRATSHYLIYVSKSPIGYKIMKEIMWKSSTEKDDGVAGFAYLPTEPQYASLFPHARPLDELGEDLLESYAGKTMTVKEIYDVHNIGTPFVPANYKEALRRLEKENRIKVTPTKRPVKNGIKTMGDKVKIEFPA